MQDSDKGAATICGGIYMSDIPSFPYHLLGEERCMKSASNLTRSNATDFFNILAQVPVTTITEFFQLSKANEAITACKTEAYTALRYWLWMKI